MQRVKEKYNCRDKEKAPEYYRANKDVIKEKANSKYENLTEEEKVKKDTILRTDTTK